MRFKKRSFVSFLVFSFLFTQWFLINNVFALNDISNLADHIVISEIQIGGITSNDEFIELYNPTSVEKDISSYSLQYQSEGGTTFYKKNFEEGASLAPYGFFLVAHNEFQGTQEPDMRSSSFSMASQGKIFFVAAQAKLDGTDFSLVEDEVYWSGLVNSQSIERKAESDSTSESMMAGGEHEFFGNGFDTNNFDADFVARISSEPQNRLSPDEPIPIATNASEEIDSSSEGLKEESNQNIEEEKASSAAENVLEETSGDSPKTIVINEVFPNPENEDNEFIELRNIGENNVDLLGWKITDETHEYIIESTDFSVTVLEPQRYFLLPKSITGLSLNNSGESVLLFDNFEVFQSVIQYESAPEEKSYSRREDSWWEWTSHVSPGEENIFLAPNETPIAKLQVEGSFFTEESLLFSAEGSSDPEGESLQYSWQWSDDVGTGGSKVSRIFYKAGSYEMYLTVYDNFGAKNELLYEFEISENPNKVVSSNSEENITINKTNSSLASSESSSLSEVISETSMLQSGNAITNFSKNVLITALLPNPDGKDTDEWLELYNKETSDVNLAGWQIDDQEGGSSPYTFPENVFLGAGKYLVLHSDLTHIVFNNKKDDARLLHPDGNIVERISYSDAKEGEILFYRDGEYVWEQEGQNDNQVFAAFDARGEENISQEKEIEIETQKENVQEVSLFSSEKEANSVALSSNVDGSLSIISIQSAKKQTIGTLVRVRGMVTILPGMLGPQYFYIGDQNDGVQIYMSKKDFPKLSLGNFIEIQGVISESRGEKRIKVMKKEDIQIAIGLNNDSVLPLTLDHFDDSAIGKFVQAQGEIFERTTKYLILSLGNGERKVNLRIIQPDNISVLPSEKSVVKVQGIIMKKKGEYEIVPRNMNDIEILSTPTFSSSEVKKTTLMSKIPYDAKYFFFLLIVCLSVVVVSVFLWIFRRKSQSLAKKEKIGYDNMYL